jgi:phosphopentomutase
LFNRIIIIVLDSVGIGALPDAAEYGDHGVNTLGNIARSQGGLFLPTMEKLGLGLIEPVAGLRQDVAPAGWYGKMAEISKGKDTTTGHWEMAGCPVLKPFPVYPAGFPDELIERFTAVTGRRILGNFAASGTEIIASLGAEHLRTGFPIVYTSADSVLQIAAHEDIIPLQELYAMGRAVREQVCVGDHAVGRVIVRPFIGSPGNFTRTANRHDYSIKPIAPTVLDKLKESGRQVIGVGKIAAIFADQGITATHPTKSNDDGMATVLRLLREVKAEALIFANLVEFDSIYGHRNDSTGYAQALQRVDGQLALLLTELGPADLLLITADHGCDPTAAGTDHTREYVPLLAYRRDGGGGSLGIRGSFADVAATVAENFSLTAMPYGRSFLTDIAR